VVVTTGHGLKDTAGALAAGEEPDRIPPDVAAVERRYAVD